VLERLGSSRGDTLFEADADAFFRAERVDGGAELEPGFSVVVVTDGEGTLGGESVRRGSTVLVAAGAGRVRLEGAVRAIRCRPPLP
jgi:mannose-6-phosphate isomerase